MKIGNVPSGKANTLPTLRWVGPVSRRLRCCNKSSGRLLTRVPTAACFFEKLQSRRCCRVSPTHALTCSGRPVVALVRKPCQFQTASTQTSFLCRRLLRFSEISLRAWTAAGIDYFTFFLFFLPPSKKIFTQLNLLLRFCRVFWTIGQKRRPCCFRGLDTVVVF